MTFLPFGHKGKKPNGVEKSPSSGVPFIGDRSQSAKSHRISASAPSSSAPRCTGASCTHITYDDWDKGGIFDWYREQPCTTIRRIELRKERVRFEHEFILVFLDSGKVYRVDRRPLGDRNPQSILPHGTEAEDTITDVDDDDLEMIHTETDAEILLKFNENKPDMYTIVAICVAVRMDSTTRNYTLQNYNCYFLARTIVTLVARYCLLQSCTANGGLRWDCITESAISCHIFGEDWCNLRMAIRSAIVARVEKLLLDSLKDYGGARITKEKDLNRLKSVVKKVVHGKVVMHQEIDVDGEVQRAVNEWILNATQVTLWHENLERHLNVESYRTTAEGALTGLVRSVLDLPDKKVERAYAHVLEYCTKKRPVKINIPPQLLERIPVGALEKLPPDLLAKSPCNMLQSVSISYLERLPPDVFLRMSDSTTVTLPNNLNHVPSRILNVALERMQRLLDQPNNPDRDCAVRLLHQLPSDQLEKLAQTYIAMRDVGFAVEPNLSAKAPLSATDDQSGPKPERVESSTLLRPVNPNVTGSLIRALSSPGLNLALPLIVKLIPETSLKFIPPEQISTRFLDKIPERLLPMLSESLLMRPQSLEERLAEVLFKNIPRGLLNNLPNNLTPLLRRVINSDACESDELREELRNRIWEILKHTLFAACGEMPVNILQVSVRKHSRKGKKTITLRNHEEVQRHILDMMRRHSKMVVNLAHFGIGEQNLFNELRDKTEHMWQEVRLRCQNRRSSTVLVDA